MKKIQSLALLMVMMISCKDKNAETPREIEKDFKEEVEIITTSYPESLSRVFDAHGGLELWNTMETLEFSVEKPGGYEITTTDLKERFTLIEMPKHTIGYNAESLWLKNRDETTYEDNPAFYYNLMFYFYAMPFVLADDGIQYTDAEPLEFEGKTYPGIQISYDDGVGASSNDNYILYYDPDSHKTTWLAYTVTFGSDQKSKEWHYIHYGNWQEVEGLLLPETMSWYHVENNLPTQLEKTVTFVSPMLTTVKMDSRVFSMPQGAELIQ